MGSSHPELTRFAANETVRLWQPDELANQGKMPATALAWLWWLLTPLATSQHRPCSTASSGSLMLTLAPPSPASKLPTLKFGNYGSTPRWGKCISQNMGHHLMESGCHIVDSRPERTKPTDKRSSKKFVLSVAWSSNGRRIACDSRDRTVSIFDADRGRFLHHLEGHFMSVKSLVFSPVEPWLLFTGSNDTHVHMYDAKGKTLVEAMSGHVSWVLSVDVSTDGAAVATGSSDRTVRLWDISMRGAVQIMSNHTDQV